MENNKKYFRYNTSETPDLFTEVSLPMWVWNEAVREEKLEETQSQYIASFLSGCLLTIMIIWIFFR